MKYFLQIVFSAALLLSAQAFAASDASVIIRCEGNCDSAVSSIEARGGSITYQYKYVDAIAASVPFQHYGAIGGFSGVAHVWKDVEIEAPKAVESVDVGEFQILDATPAEVIPADFLESTLLTRIGPLFGEGLNGDGVNVVVIDTGTAEVPAFNRLDCPTEGPTVIGGETFIERADASEPPATSPLNGPHGTWVGTTVAANAIFGFEGVFANAVATYSPDSAIIDIAPGVTGVPMIGTAPCAQIYALKTFLAAGGGAPRSDIAAAMERAIEMRENYNNGIPSEPVAGNGTPDDPYVYDSLKVDVVNMSLGGATLFAGFEITDQLTEKMLEVGITVINSAGNSGHAAMTGGSAGTGFGTLTAGAASLVHNERILRDLQFGAGVGALYRAADHHQMATFSSRGPSPDGRANVDAVANGFANFVMGPTGVINLVSGTSFSAPTIAGAAATLRQAFPNASALQIRNALVETADPGFLGDNPGPIDQGHGFIDLVAAYNALEAGEVSNTLPSSPAGNSVRGNIASVGLKTIQLGNSGYGTRLEGLVPGEVAHFFLDIDDRVDALNVSFSNITPELPPGQQNQFFGDDLFVVVQDSITSTDATLADGFIADDTTLVAANPGTGLVRVAVMGDWTNAGSITADMQIEAVNTKRPKITERDRAQEGDLLFYTVNVPERAEQANFELHWEQDWGRFPTDDLDVIIVPPRDGAPIFQGATLDSPERVVIDDPVPGDYVLVVNGFTVWGDRGDHAQFSVYAFDENGEAFSAPIKTKGTKK